MAIFQCAGCMNNLPNKQDFEVSTQGLKMNRYRFILQSPKFSKWQIIMTRRKTRGQGVAELVGALVLLVPIVLTAIDLGILAIGAAINDSICRDAARAAASGPPSEFSLGDSRNLTPDKAPYQRALSVATKLYSTNFPAKIRNTLVAVETVRDIPPNSTGGAIDGDVAITTTIDIYPPFLVGAIMGGVSLSSSHKVPITYVMKSEG